MFNVNPILHYFFGIAIIQKLNLKIQIKISYISIIHAEKHENKKCEHVSIANSSS